MTENPEPYIVKKNKLDRIEWAHQELNRFAEMVRKGQRCKLVFTFADDERLAFLEHWQPVIK